MVPFKAWQAYLFAATATLTTLLVRLALESRLEGHPTLVMFSLPIMLSAYLGGLGPGVLATALTCPLAAYYLLPPIHSFVVTSGAARWQLFFIGLAGVVISGLNEAVHRARRRAEKETRERLRAEEALLQASALQRAIFNSANFSSIATDANGVIQIFNVGAERMLGYTAAEVTNRITPVDLHDYDELMARAGALSLEFRTPIATAFEALVFKAARGIEDIYELTKIRKDGSRFPAVVSVTALRDAQDAIIGYLLIGTDNTLRKEAQEERLQAEAARRLSEARYRTLFDCAPDGIVIANPKSYYLDANGSICRMLGYTRDEFVGLHASDIVTRAELEHIEPALRTIGAATDYHREWQFRRKDGSVLDAEVIATKLPDGNMLGMIRDVTERKRLEQALQLKNVELVAASRMKSEFLANMSHELRTPLNAIIGFSEVLGDGLIGEMTVQQRKFIGDIFSSGSHLLALINDILDLSKVEAGKMDLDLEAVDVSALLASSLSIIREKAATRQIRLTLDAADARGLLQVDARKVKQIVYNLLSNAVKFAKPGGEVTLRATRVTRDQAGRMSGVKASRSFPLPESEFAEFLEIRVTDNGIGISGDGLERLFTPFSQIDSGLARHYEGTGLGLAMVKSMAELHGGTVAVESSAGEGACFAVWLPIVAPQDVDARTAVRPVPAAFAAAPGERVALVVESDFKAAELIRLQLQLEGFTVLHAASAEAALALAVQQPLSLITLDILLPNMDGWEFLGRIKRVPDLQRVPVVIISIDADSNKGFALGAAAVMQKPISRRQLYDALVDLGVCPRPPGATLKVLVVDDDRNAVEIVAADLAGLASTILRAYGGHEAIELLRRELPDVIVLDLMMPDVSGFDVIDALKEHPDTARIPVLVVTAKEITVEDRGKLSGYVTAILEKAAFDREHLTAEVRRAMSGRRTVV